MAGTAVPSGKTTACAWRIRSTCHSIPNRYNERMVRMADILAHREQILRITARRGARNVRLFGSVVRGDTRAGSDVDLLVCMDSDRSLVDQVGLVLDLQDLLGVRVDVVPEDALHRAIRDQVLHEAVAI